MTYLPPTIAIGGLDGNLLACFLSEAQWTACVQAKGQGKRFSTYLGLTLSEAEGSVNSGTHVRCLRVRPGKVKLGGLQVFVTSRVFKS